MGFPSKHLADGNHYPFTVRSGKGTLFDEGPGGAVEEAAS